MIHLLSEINLEKELEETLDDKPLDIPSTKEIQELSDTSPCKVTKLILFHFNNSYFK